MNDQTTNIRSQKKIHVRNQQMADEYTRLFFTEGKRENVIWDELSERFFLEPDTIRKIILKLVKG